MFAPLLLKVRVEFTLVPAMALTVAGLVSVNTPLAWLNALTVTGVALAVWLPAVAPSTVWSSSQVGCRWP